LAARQLRGRQVERIWGRRDLPPAFPAADAEGDPIGEIWFEDEDEAPLLVKYLFTSERLSIQVHPGDGAARARGYRRGKDEAWFVLDAEPGATIGLGLTRRVTPEELRAAALDGSIEALLDWRPASAGDVFYSPAGTIHAIGAGLALIEVQQNLDLTYRLYDYGRPRELHLDNAVAVSNPAPFPAAPAPRKAGPGRTILAGGGAFVLERWRGERRADLPAGSVLVPLAAGGTIDGAPLEPATVWAARGPVALEGEADVLAGIPSEASA
jgi:mannose-6-phosphate isomerase